MNSEKSYDSLPNFTAADCKYVTVHYPLDQTPFQNSAVF